MRHSAKVASVLLKKHRDTHTLDSLAEVADDNGNSLLHLAATVGNTEVLAALKGLWELDTPNDQGDSALHLAVWSTQTEAVTFLMQHANLGVRVGEMPI